MPEYSSGKPAVPAPNSNNGSAILLVLLIVFVVQKLSGAIQWSWWWVTSPLWMPLAIAVFVVTVRSLFQVETR